MSDKQLFRKKSLDRISSPESLDQYVRVANPGIWTILGAVILLLIGILAWGFLGRIDNTVDVAVVSDGETAKCYFLAENSEDIKPGMEITVLKETYHVGEGAFNTMMLSDEDDFVCYSLNSDLNTFVVVAPIEEAVPKGEYKGKIVIEAIKPMSFITK